MPYVELPSGETRYYDRYGNEWYNNGSGEAPTASGDYASYSDFESATAGQPSSWSGSGPLPGGIAVSGKSFSATGATTTGASPAGAAGNSFDAGGHGVLPAPDMGDMFGTGAGPSGATVPGSKFIDNTITRTSDTGR